MVHITGGGFYDNIPRALPENLGAEIDSAAWTIPPIFNLIQRWGNVDRHEMFRTFNCGVGMILIVDENAVDELAKYLDAAGEKFYKIGRVVEGQGVRID